MEKAQWTTNINIAFTFCLSENVHAADMCVMQFYEYKEAHFYLHINNGKTFYSQIDFGVLNGWYPMCSFIEFRFLPVGESSC